MLLPEVVALGAHANVIGAPRSDLKAGTHSGRTTNNVA